MVPAPPWLNCVAASHVEDERETRRVNPRLIVFVDGTSMTSWTNESRCSKRPMTSGIKLHVCHRSSCLMACMTCASGALTLMMAGRAKRRDNVSPE